MPMKLRPVPIQIPEKSPHSRPVRLNRSLTGYLYFSLLDLHVNCVLRTLCRL